MQDVSRTIGATVLIKIAGKEVKLKEWAIADVGELQELALKQKRNRKIEAAAQAMKYLPSDEGKALLEKSLEEAESISLLSDEDFEHFLRSAIGVNSFFSVLINRQHPKQFTSEEIAASLVPGEVDQAWMPTLMGVTPVGNEIGQSNLAEQSQEKQ